MTYDIVSKLHHQNQAFGRLLVSLENVFFGLATSDLLVLFGIKKQVAQVTCSVSSKGKVARKGSAYSRTRSVL
jgi:hypothetical protein